MFHIVDWLLNSIKLDFNDLYIYNNKIYEKKRIEEFKNKHKYQFIDIINQYDIKNKKNNTNTQLSYNEILNEYKFTDNYVDSLYNDNILYRINERPDIKILLYKDGHYEIYNEIFNIVIGGKNKKIK